MKYTSTEERLPFTDRMEQVRADIKARLKPRNAREDSRIEPVPHHGRPPLPISLRSIPSALI